MTDIIDALIPALFILLVAFIFWGLGWLIHVDQTNTQQLAEECIAAGQQWVIGNCVK